MGKNDLIFQNEIVGTTLVCIILYIIHTDSTQCINNWSEKFSPNAYILYNKTYKARI